MSRFTLNKNNFCKHGRCDQFSSLISFVLFKECECATYLHRLRLQGPEHLFKGRVKSKLCWDNAMYCHSLCNLVAPTVEQFLVFHYESSFMLNVTYVMNRKEL